MIKHSAAISFGTGPGSGGHSDDATPRPSARGGPDGPWRAITVGRTGLEQTLRRESGIELIRARSTFEAVGELSDALESDAQATEANAGAAPALRCVVLVAHECAADEIAGSFVAAMKSMQPHVAVLLVARADGTASDMARAAFDAVITAETSPDDVRRVAASVLNTSAPGLVQVKPASAARDEAARQQATESAAAVAGAAWVPAGGPVGGPSSSARAEAGRQEPAGTGEKKHDAPLIGQSDRSGRIDWSAQSQGPDRAPAAVERTHGGGMPGGGMPGGVGPDGALPGDAPLLAALLAGRDVVLAALEVLRARTGDASVTFAPAEASAPPPVAGLGESLEPVVHSGTLFGYLRFSSHGTARGDRVVAASWLSMYFALQAQQKALRTAAMVDDLTGAYNRRYFEHFMSAALAQAQRERHTLTLLVFDLDGFKGFNDRFGHAAGDEILRETVALLKSVIRPADKVCRIGGDEFAVIFYEPTGPRDIGSKPPEDVTIIAKRFQQQVRAHRFPKLGGSAPGALTISGGLATFPWDGRTATELLAHADNLALAAKRDGKNAIRIGPDGSSRSSSYGAPAT